MEQVGLLVVFALVWLVQLAVRMLRARRASSAPAPTPPPARPSPPAPGKLPVGIPVHARVPEAPPALVAARLPQSARPRTRLGTRRELRRAIVLREVLGPCRALQSTAR